ncbi:Transcriptional regulator [Planoprotostelium fungivorum]|uniref:Transcriptional regulator n=1 Tax=Planoprotostelium fungivorum TaxID=1890364 RepID=A0A2P6NJZ2_9EUKA|nr:Transcriptional regulator [Planoprotostelium fungivorum]
MQRTTGLFRQIQTGGFKVNRSPITFPVKANLNLVRWNSGEIKKVSFATPQNVIHHLRTGVEVYILDVRPAEDYKTKRVSGALCFPLETLETRAAKLVERDRVIYIHCDKVESAMVSMQAAQILKAQGFQKVEVLNANYDDLKAAGFMYYE